MELEKEGQVLQRVEEILFQDDDPIAKVQELVDLGFDEEAASTIVERYQIGQTDIVYYEQLPGYREY